MANTPWVCRLPDLWSKLTNPFIGAGIKDEDWRMPDIAAALTNRRYDERTIAYTECAVLVYWPAMWQFLPGFFFFFFPFFWALWMSATFKVSRLTSAAC